MPPTKQGMIDRIGKILESHDGKLANDKGILVTEGKECVEEILAAVKASILAKEARDASR